MMNDTTMALAAATPPQGRESCNCAGKDCDGPSACARYATPALTGAGQEGWFRSEFGATSWPSFESVSANLPQEQWGMSTARPAASPSQLSSRRAIRCIRVPLCASYALPRSTYEQPARHTNRKGGPATPPKHD